MSKELTIFQEIKALSIYDFDFLVIKDKEGKQQFVNTSENIYRALKQLPLFADRIRFNTFSQRKQIKFEWLGQTKWENIKDVDYQNMIGVFANTFPYIPLFAKMSVPTISGLVERVAYENAYNPIEKYLESLEWDGVARVNYWLDKVYGCGDSDLYKKLGRNWIVQYMRRVTSPENTSTQADYVIVLEGVEGLGKSSVLRDLAIIGREDDLNGQHVEMVSLPNKKDFAEKLLGASIVEFAEGSLVSRSDIQTLKQQITNVSDTFRPAFGRESNTYFRRCVFAMNTNDQEYLKDMTSARRWHPVPVEKKTDLLWLKENKEQLFAEAYSIHKSGEKTWEGIEQLQELIEEQESRRVKRVEEEFILDWFKKQDKSKLELGLTVSEVFDGALKEPMNKLGIDQSVSTIIGSILLHIFKFKKKQKSDGNRYYFPTEATFKKFGNPDENLSVEPKGLEELF